VIRAGRNALIAAPTGSGKTLAAFLAAIDALVREGLAGGLPDETSVVYVSPLKALSNDVQKNLAVPLAGIRGELAALGLPDVDIRTLVRTGSRGSDCRPRSGRSRRWRGFWWGLRPAPKPFEPERRLRRPGRATQMEAARGP
jgi:ATP-dependent Lhr-like helicase